MSGHTRRFVALAAAMALLVAGVAADQAKPSPPAATAARPNDEGGSTKLIAPVRGLAQIDYVRPASVRKGGMIVTTIRVKNMMPAPIVGLKVDEFWYGKSGDHVGGGSQRLRRPLLPGETADIVIQFKAAADMNRNSYKFTHANGDVKPSEVRRLDPPKKP